MTELSQAAAKSLNLREAGEGKANSNNKTVANSNGQHDDIMDELIGDLC